MRLVFIPNFVFVGPLINSFFDVHTVDDAEVRIADVSRQLSAAMPGRFNQAELKKFFDGVDADGNGLMTRTELVLHLRQQVVSILGLGRHLSVRIPPRNRSPVHPPIDASIQGEP